MSLQLDVGFMVSIKPIEDVIVDKVGLYAYTLQGNSRAHALDSRAGFYNAVIVDVRSIRRTKRISIQTPYRLVNQCHLPLQFKVQSPSSPFSEFGCARQRLHQVYFDTTTRPPELCSALLRFLRA
jgi:hypothetical protein